MYTRRALCESARARNNVRVLQIKKLRFVFHSNLRCVVQSKTRDMETDPGTSPWPDGWSSPLFLSLFLSFATIQFFFRARTCVSSVSSSPSLYALSCSSFLPTVKNFYTFLAGPDGQVQRRVCRAVCSLLNESRRSSVSPSVPPPLSSCPPSPSRTSFAGPSPASFL